MLRWALPLGRWALGMPMPMLVALVSATSAPAQVYEVADNGDLATYDRPTVFTSSGAEAIEQDDSRKLTSRFVANGPVWPQIDQEARRHGLPPALLRAVAWQESRGRVGAVSSKGALGVMQLMPATAAYLGVDPLDLKDNLRGGAMFLRQQLDRFGSVPLALAAYNAGPAAVKRFGGVPPYRETRSYVASILARLQPEPVQSPLLISAGDTSQ